MAENKRSFVLYCDLIHTVEMLPPEKAGDLFIHILKYVNDQSPKTNDMVIQIAFEPIKQQLKRDLEKWGSTKEKRVLAGKKGGLAKQANARNAKQKQANLAVNDSVSVNVNVSKGYIYNKFYDKQVSTANDDGNQNYEKFVRVLFGESELDEPLNNVLSLQKQVTYKQFQTIEAYKMKHKFSVSKYLVRMENWKDLKKKNTSVQATLLNWIRKDYD